MKIFFVGLLLLISLSSCTETPNAPDWVFVNYWAIWCAPCREEIPEFNALAKDNSQKLSVRSVNFDNEQGSKLQEQRQALDIQFASLSINEQKALKPVRPNTLPTTYVYFKNTLVATLVGPQTQEKLLAIMHSQ